VLDQGHTTNIGLANIFTFFVSIYFFFLKTLFFFTSILKKSKFLCNFYLNFTMYISCLQTYYIIISCAYFFNSNFLVSKLINAEKIKK